MHLSHLFPNEKLIADPVITALCENSQNAEKGALFFAHTGSRDQGSKYIHAALDKDCVAIVVPVDTSVTDIPATIPVIKTPNTRAELARCARLFYPRAPRHIVAVTGTSGKTSTVYFAQQFLNLSGSRAVALGTLGLNGAITRDGLLTTPEAPELHRTLQELADQNIDALAMEASSQALAQHRLDAVPLTAAAFTNLSRDHLDYHGTPENYLAAKQRLFTDILPPHGTLVVNTDDAASTQIIAAAKTKGQKIIRFGRTDADLTLLTQTLTSTGQNLTLRYQEQNYDLTLNIAGAFQAYNVLAAMGLCLALDIPIAQLVAGASKLQAPPGRMQQILGHPLGAAIYVDYAHKPDALENVLKDLRAHKPERLICVFGCGGDRDAGKRPLMGQIAANYATDIIVTDDNPRSENPKAIRAAILAACPGAQEISNRRTAIHTAIQMAGARDIVVIAGKGHEQGQKFADHTDPFDDVAECIAAIKAIPNASRPTATAAH